MSVSICVVPEVQANIIEVLRYAAEASSTAEKGCCSRLLKNVKTFVAVVAVVHEPLCLFLSASSQKFKLIIINDTLGRSLEPVVTECKEHTIHTQTQIVASRKPKYYRSITVCSRSKQHSREKKLLQQAVEEAGVPTG